MHASDADLIDSSNGIHHSDTAAQLDLDFAARGLSVLPQHEDIALPTTIVKRDGRIVAFDPVRIERAISRCFAALGREPYTPIPELALRVVNIMCARPGVPSVEIVQDAVELTLQAAGEFEAAKAYILYRAEHAKQRQERPIPDEVRAAFAEADQYFPTPIQKFQFFDKYSRFEYSKGRRETWIETVDRAVDFLHELVQTNTGVDLGADTYQHLRRMILEMRSMPSMRLLAMAGAPARRDNTSIYNCSYLPVESIDSFAEALLISMAGCGVGFSVESRYVESFPRVQRQRGWSPLRHVIDDSAQGWAAAVRLGMQSWFEGGDVDFNFDQIRPAGAPLRTKGGRASGPGPLRTMLEFARSRILARQGMHLRPIDAHDIMCMAGNAAVSGGVRRTAMISLFDYDDLEMRLCKSGDFEHDNSQRWNANNSAVWPERGLDQLQVMEQVLDMVKSQRGEPGIFNRKAALELIPDRRKQLGYLEMGTNPCHRGTNLVHTTAGLVPIRDLVGREFSVLVPTGEIARAVAYPTGRKPLHRVTFDNGMSIDLTENHRLVMADGSKRAVADLKPEDEIVVAQHEIAPYDASDSHTEEEGLRLGWNAGDGWLTYHSNLQRTQAGFVFGFQDQDVATSIETSIGERIERRRPLLKLRPERGVSELTTTNRQFTRYFTQERGATHTSWGVPVSVMQGNREFQRGYLRGLFTAHGHVEVARPREETFNGTKRIRLVSAHGKLVSDVQLLLSTFGIRSRVGFTVTYGPEGQTYNRYDLNIGGTNVDSFRVKIGFIPGLPKALAHEAGLAKPWRTIEDRRTTRVVALEPLGIVEDVYNLTVNHPLHEFAVNGIISANCGEIVLRKYQFCNLSIAVARSDDTLETLKEKVQAATIIGTIQSLATYFPDLRPIWKQNCEEERLLGVDITGQMDSPVTHDREVMRTLRQVATETNREFAARLGINQSAAITTVKPSGNSSQLLNCSSGLHARWAPYYERNVRVAATSPIFKVLRDAGVPMDPENGQTRDDANTWVVHFPMKSPTGAVTRKDRGAIEQCNYWLHNKLNWTDHNPSVTCTYRPDEIIELTKWIWEHCDFIGGMAFLPAFDAQYAQLPYIEITKDEYDRRVMEFPEIDFSKIWRYESTDLTNAAQELACLAGRCEADA
jgi:ribonucleotide reductase, class II